MQIYLASKKILSTPEAKFINKFYNTFRFMFLIWPRNTTKQPKINAKQTNNECNLKLKYRRVSLSHCLLKRQE